MDNVVVGQDTFKDSEKIIPYCGTQETEDTFNFVTVRSFYLPPHPLLPPFLK